MEQFLADMALQFPILFTVFLLLGIFRAIFKPAMLVIEAYVVATPDKSDDEKLASVKQSKIYLGLVWVVDYLMSIKLPTKKEDVAALPVGQANDLPKAS